MEQLTETKFAESPGLSPCYRVT